MPAYLWRYARAGRAQRRAWAAASGSSSPASTIPASSTRSQVRSALNISIDECETRVFTGSMSGEPMFQAKAEIVVPEGVEEANLRTTLEALAKDLMVDVELAPV